MGRKVSGYAHGMTRQYIPESFENRDDAEPVTVWISQPTEKQKREILAQSKTELLYSEDGEILTDADGLPRIKPDLDGSIAWYSMICARFVSTVANYEAADGSPITTGKLLAEHGETSFITEIGAEVISGASLKEEEKKTLSERSDSSSQQIRHSIGTVTNAKSNGSTGGADAAPMPTA